MDADVDTVRNGQAGVVMLAVAKKLEGQPDHPVNHGGLCARGQAAIQLTYHPDRLTQPMKRKGARGSGAFEPIAWDAAIAELVATLDALAAAGNQKAMACLTRPGHNGRTRALTAFATAFGAPAPIAFEFFGNDVLRRANALVFGREQLPTFDLARSRFVISFGADLLGTWNSPVSQSAAYGEMRRGHPQARGKLVQVESRMTMTGANADEWVPARPGTEGVVALGLAHVILANKLRPSDGAGRAASHVDGWAAGLTEYAPERVEQITGVPARRLDRLARELAEFSPAVAVVGGAPLAQSNGMFTAVAVNALNVLLGSVDQAGGMSFTPGVPPSIPFRTAALDALASAQVVLLGDADVIYGTPAALKARDALAKIPFIASFGSFIDDTSVHADLILPDHSFLESWVDSTPESGARDAVTSVAGPVMKPLYQTRATADVLIDIAGKLKPPVALPWKTAEETAKDKAKPAAVAFADGLRPGPYKYEDARFEGDAKEFPFHFLPYQSVMFGDGSSAHLPWLQELPDPLTSAMWSSWVEINPQTASRMGIADGDVLEVASPHGTLRAPAVIFPGIAPDIVAMPVGQGHDTFTRYASRRGANPIAILAPSIEPETGTLAWAATRVKVSRVAAADGSLIMYAGEMRERPRERER
jgi:anaerobic selenocysteine-containing dehydrogenase